MLRVTRWRMRTRTILWKILAKVPRDSQIQRVVCISYFFCRHVAAYISKFVIV